MVLYAIDNKGLGRLMLTPSRQEAETLEEWFSRHPAAQCEIVTVNPIDEFRYYLKGGIDKILEQYNSLGEDVRITGHSALALLTGVLAQQYVSQCVAYIANDQLLPAVLTGTMAVVAGSLSLANIYSLVNNLSIKGTDIDTKTYI